MSWLVSLALTLAAQSPTPGKAMRVAVYEFKASGIEPRAQEVVTQALVLELRKLERVSVVSMDEVRAMLDMEAQKQLLGCAADSCLAEIADSLGVDVVVIGSMVRVGDESVFGLKRIDQKAAAAVGQVNERLRPDDGNEFLAAIGPAVEKLFPDHAVRAGQTRGVAEEVTRRLHPPPLPPWLSASVASAAAVALGLTGVFATLNVVSRQDLDDATEAAKRSNYPAAEYAAKRERTDALAVASLVGAGVTVVIAATAVVLFLQTDWGPPE